MSLLSAAHLRAFNIKCFEKRTFPWKLPIQNRELQLFAQQSEAFYRVKQKVPT
jgi:hypothetical protein